MNALFIIATLCLAVANAGPIQNKPMERDDMFEGDIAGMLSKTLGTTGQLWTDGILPITFADGYYGDYDKAQIKNAAMLIEDVTGGCIKVQFFDDATSANCGNNCGGTNPKNHIQLYKGGGCWSYVGMSGGRQSVSLDNGCLSDGTIIHELTHALGFWHEQSRPDRDQYVTINLNTVYSGHHHNFEIRDKDTTTNGIPYDYYSIMHYDSFAFTQDWNVPSIIPKQAGVELVHSSYKSGYTPLDVQAVRKLYANAGVSRCSGAFTTSKPRPTPVKTTTPDPNGHTCTEKGVYFSKYCNVVHQCGADLKHTTWDCGTQYATYLDVDNAFCSASTNCPNYGVGGKI